MTHNLGRKNRVSSMVITGNGNGLAGYAITKAKEMKQSLNTAKRKAATKVLYFNRYNDHTGKIYFYLFYVLPSLIKVI